MNKKLLVACVVMVACFCMTNVAWGTLPASKINGKYYLSQSPWSGALATAITDVNNINAQVTLVIDANATLSSSLVVDKEVALEFISGYQVTIPNGYSLTVNGPVIAGLYQIFVDNTTGKNGVLGDVQVEDVLPEWWGAARNVVTDSSAAIIKAVNLAQAGASGRKSVAFADGSYYVNSPIPLVNNKPITIKGAGFYNSRVVANATMASVFQMSDSAVYERYTFTDILINGNLKANYCIYAGAGEIKSIRCTRVLAMGALQAGVSIGWSICCNFIDCEFINNGDATHVANGLEFRNGGYYHNGINIIASKVIGNTGIGILAVNGFLFNVSECVIEANSACGIALCIGERVNIVNNYFELNGNVGLTVMTPSVLVQSHIFINGNTSLTSLGNSYQADGIKISGNTYSNDGYAAPNCFVYAASLFNGKIESNYKPTGDVCQELFAKREYPTYSYRNVSLNGQTFNYAPSVTAGSSVQIEALSYLSASYPATVKIIATGNGASSDMSFEVNVLIKDDQTIGGYSFSNQINTTMSAAPTISNANLTLNNLPAGDWTFVYMVSSIKIN